MTEIFTERRREPRTKIDLSVRVWGIDAQGVRFLREVTASEVSLSGALLSHLKLEIRIGDVVGVAYAGKSARYKVVWVRDCGPEKGIQAAVHRMATDECPWRERLSEAKAATASCASHPAMTHDDAVPPVAGPSPASRT
jgi:hypothetical protein